MLLTHFYRFPATMTCIVSPERRMCSLYERKKTYFLISFSTLDSKIYGRRPNFFQNCLNCLLYSGIHVFIKNHFIRSLHVEARTLFKFEYCYDYKQSRIRKPVWFIAVEFAWILCNLCSKCFVEEFPLNLTMSLVSYLNTLHWYYFQATKYAVKIKELLRNF